MTHAPWIETAQAQEPQFGDFVEFSEQLVAILSHQFFKQERRFKPIFIEKLTFVE